MYILQSLQGHLSVALSVISFLNNSSYVAFFIALGTGAREDMVYVPKYAERIHLLFRVELFLRL